MNSWDTDGSNPNAWLPITNSWDTMGTIINVNTIESNDLTESEACCIRCLNDGVEIEKKYLKKYGNLPKDCLEKDYVMALKDDKARAKLISLAIKFSPKSLLYNLPITIKDRLLKEIGVKDFIKRIELYECSDCWQKVCLKCLWTKENEIINGEKIICQFCFDEKIVVKYGVCEDCDNQTEIFKCEDCLNFKCRSCLYDDEWDERLQDGIFLCYECYKIGHRISNLLANG